MLVVKNCYSKIYICTILSGANTQESHPHSHGDQCSQCSCKGKTDGAIKNEKRTIRNSEMETGVKKSLMYQGLSQFRQEK